MARTPLFRSLRRSLLLAQRARAGSRSTAEVIAEYRESRRTFTRREFLRTSSGAALGVGLLGCGPTGSASGGGGEAEVVIVGAGIAGLTAGWRLKQAGVRVRILEAQSRVGGRMFSLRGHFPDGQVAELGGELIDSGHHHMHAMAAELGIGLDDLKGGETEREEVWHFGGSVRSEREVVEAFRPVLAHIERDLETLDTLEDWPWITYQHPNGAEWLDNTTLSQWLGEVEMDAWFRTLLDVGFTTEFGLEADRQSALSLHSMVGLDPDEFLIYGDSDERYHVRGGNDLITGALAERLEGEIEIDSVVESIRGGGDDDFTLSVRTGGSSREVRAPRLLLTLPFTMLREVELDVELPPVKRQAIESLAYGTNAKLMMGFRDRIWRSEHGSAGSVFTDLPFQITWETSREQPGMAGILTNFTGGRQGEELGTGSAEEQAQRVVGELEQVFPGIGAVHDPASAVRFHWPTFAWTQGSYACYGPGDWTGFGGTEAEPVGALHFAGEHTAEEAQGFMEGGCESGARAATEILQAMGRGAEASAAYERPDLRLKEADLPRPA